MMCLRTLSPEFVAYRLSLIRNWQGCLVTVCTSPVSFKSTSFNQRFFNKIRSSTRNPALQHSVLRNLCCTKNMGSSISRGRKFSLTKTVSSKNADALLGHAKFSSSTEIVEAVVCNENEIEENQMKVVDLGDEGGKVLLVKQKGKISALGTKCTHYGAPLVSGHLGDGRVRCQWHGACFNIANGDIEDFPGLDSLPCYEVKVANGQVVVRADKQLLMSNKRVKPFVSTIKPTRATFIVVGGGPAGANCVETLRQQGFDGRIIFVVGERYLPYDRIKLSKSLDVEIDKIVLRSIEFYQERNIEIMLHTQIVGLSPTKKEISLSNGQTVNYDKIFLATGATPRRLKVSGAELKNIFVLRTAEDATQIKEVLTKSSNVVILGTSFIGMEIAAFCVDKVNSVTVIGKDIPFKAAFGSEIGNRILTFYQEKNIQFRLQTSIEKFEGEGGKLNAVVLSDSTKLPADICIVGIGVIPNTHYLTSSGIELQKNGTLEVNENKTTHYLGYYAASKNWNALPCKPCPKVAPTTHLPVTQSVLPLTIPAAEWSAKRLDFVYKFLQTKYPDVYAGGDIALAPVLGQKASIGHWGLANYHGHIAAFNMIDQKKPLRAVPFFWTMLFGKGFRYTGYTKSFDDVVIDGSLEEFKFIAFHCEGDTVVAVTTIGRDPLAAKFAEMLYEGKQLKKNKISEWLL